MKECKKCGDPKSPEEFPLYGRPKKKGTRRAICRDCEKKRNQEYYQKNKERIKARVKPKEEKDWGKDVNDPWVAFALRIVTAAVDDYRKRPLERCPECGEINIRCVRHFFGTTHFEALAEFGDFNPDFIRENVLA